MKMSLASEFTSTTSQRSDAFNIVAVLVFRNTSLARPRTCKAKAKDSKFVLEDTPRTKAKDNNTAVVY